jgi:hypothetical protein
MLQVAVLVVLVTSNIPDEGLGQRMPVLINCIPPTASTTVATLSTLVVGPRVVASCATAVDEAAGTIMVITRTPAVVLESNIAVPSALLSASVGVITVALRAMLEIPLSIVGVATDEGRRR